MNTNNFNPRSPCGERLRWVCFNGAPSIISIHAPLVGSDGWTYAPHRVPPYFNPRSPCGERLSNLGAGWRPGVFQSTLPLWGATGRATAAEIQDRDFNPRSPCGERLWRKPGIPDKSPDSSLSIADCIEFFPTVNLNICAVQRTVEAIQRKASRGKPHA